jgi:hypothetical protein
MAESKLKQDRQAQPDNSHQQQLFNRQIFPPEKKVDYCLN